MPAPKGNKNAARARSYRDALVWALENYKDGSIKQGQAIRQVAVRQVQKALEGDMTAAREIADRLDGRAAQSVALTGGDENDIPIAITIKGK